MYELFCGDIFDMKCDLLVVPCNNYGGISTNVCISLRNNNIPYDLRKMNAGDVVFLTNIKHCTNAWAVAFAASVDVCQAKCTEEYLHKICESIKDYCKCNSLNRINIPLLGTGAGGMTNQESFQILKECFQDEPRITLRIFAYSEKVYFELKEQIETEKEKNMVKNPRVFISYAGDDPENQKWVKKFACRLRENGVDARLDVFHLKPGQDLPQWMTNELLMADKVLLICDKYYAEKADLKRGGVGWETMIIHGDMMSHLQSDKYICIVREENIDTGLPIYVKSRYSLHWTEPEIKEEAFRQLMYNLFDCNVEPEIGDVPAYIKNQKKK